MNLSAVRQKSFQTLNFPTTVTAARSKTSPNFGVHKIHGTAGTPKELPLQKKGSLNLPDICLPHFLTNSTSNIHFVRRANCLSRMHRLFHGNSN